MQKPPPWGGGGGRWRETGEEVRALKDFLLIKERETVPTSTRFCCPSPILPYLVEVETPPPLWYFAQECHESS